MLEHSFRGIERRSDVLPVGETASQGRELFLSIGEKNTPDRFPPAR